jgi:surfactin synthase thioesterase subunit
MDNLLAVLRTQYRELVQRIKPDRVVLYGHSIGAVIGVALLHSLTNGPDMPVPAKAIFSGHGGPQITPRMQLSDLSTNELIAYFKSIGSMPDEVALHPELIDYILPILRNDLQLYESYVSVYVEKLKIPLLIVNGNQDNISEENISGWERETTGEVKFVELEGDHFFMRQYPDTFAGLLAAFLQQERCTSAVKYGGEAVPY